ncbi:hypothetical protein [Methylosinus sp. C49]|uniref:hypothetical protein n=1 Tax=Methylosinus sp. C49 TaxID=2699395 RepID=UPI00137A88F9|nr:hypothetical protein [Methylosinus sp. C49]
MNRESSSPQIHPNANRASNALVAFFADAITIGIGAGALGGAVAGTVVLLLDGSSAIRERVSNAPMTHSASRVSDDLARLFERSARERSEASESQVAGMNLSQQERTAPRLSFLSDE